MSDRPVCDASAVVALLVDDGPDGSWAAAALTGASPIAPTLLPFEVANVLRRHELAGVLGPDQTAQAHADLLEASYVAPAEFASAPLVTLDARLARARGLRCRIVTR